ncbi:TrkA family potassium uptake protein [Halostella sp. JP-L12]|uniref:potassium channel family protein n=1 Tax=Halostella TaxID=1843185 RepID=UPI000EF8498D|nr:MULTISPECIES: TrkA family potassium uptake protein [Halostella]NHN47380.1 TrkA family potassium uptake protein [Halostella sp. JP-L12]
MYIIVVGAGNIGTPLIDMATRDENEVVVIEKDGAKADAAAREYDCLVLNDDATEMETLEDAGVDRADALISTTDQDAANIMVCLLATEREVPAIVSVVHNPEHMNLFRRIGVNTIEHPQSLIAGYLYRAVKRPSIKDYMRVGDTAEVFEITVDDDAPIANKTLIEADEAGLLPQGVLIVAIERNGKGDPITPRGDTEIHVDDLLTVYSQDGATPDVTNIFGHYEDHDFA